MRYMGYANEVGEAFGPLNPKVVRPSYIVAFGYVGCDTVEKTYRSYKAGSSSGEVFKTAADTFIWQLFASVLIPGYTINFVAKQTTRLMTLDIMQKSLKPVMCRYAPTAIGLAAIPFIIHPIDTAVDYVMDRTIRKIF